MNVLVIPEDWRRDQDLLKPILKAFFKEIGFSHVKLRICDNRKLHGVDQALKREVIEEILDQYRGQTDLFLLLIDRDGIDGRDRHGRRTRLDELEKWSRTILRSDQALLGEHAIEELEVWVLAGHTLPREWKWQDVRTDPNPKERYFQPFLTTHRKLTDSVPGRARIAAEAARSVHRILQLCDDDLGRLGRRLRENFARET